MRERSRNPAEAQRRRKVASALRILRRQLDDPTPEERLWLAVIEQAVREAYAGMLGDPDRQEDARAWLESEHFAEVAVTLGLHPQWARDTLQRLEGPGEAVGRGGSPSPCAAGSRAETSGAGALTRGQRHSASRRPGAACRKSAGSLA